MKNLKRKRVKQLITALMAVTLMTTSVLGSSYGVFADDTASEASQSQEQSEEDTQSGGSAEPASEKETILEEVDKSFTDTIQVFESENGEEVVVVAQFENVDKLLNDAKSNLDLEKSNEAYKALAQQEGGAVEKMIDDATDKLGKADLSASGLEPAVKDGTDLANQAIQDAGSANKGENYDDALTAKNNAEKELNAAEQKLTDATTAYNNAADQVNAIQKELDEAQKLMDYYKTLESTTSGAVASYNQAKAEFERLEEQKKDLEAMQKQYYAVMVQYYREALGKNAVFDNETGTLDVAACADIITQQKISDKANNPGNPVMQLSRELMKQIVTYMIKNDPNVDWSTADFQFGVEGSSKDARIGDVYKSTDSKETTPSGAHKDMVAIDTKKAVKGDDGEEHKGIADNYNWAGKGNNDGGRTNRVKVTYKDKNNQPQTVYFNYIFKQTNTVKNGKQLIYDGETKDDLDFGEGPIYLALISSDDNGKTWKSTPVNTELDDYTKLTAAVEEYKKNNEEYEKAKKAFESASKKVEELKDEVGKLSEIAWADQDKLTALKDQLAEAEEELKKKEAKKNELEAKVKQARDAVNGIDLSRFNDTSDDDNTDEGTSTTGLPGGVGPDITVMPLTAGTAGGVAGVRTGRRVAGEAANDVATGNDAANEQVAQNTVAQMADNQMPMSATADGNTKKEGTKISDPEIPLANTPFEEGMNMNWLWLLAVAAAVIVTVVAYENHKKKINANKELKK